MSAFKVGDVCVLQNLPSRVAHFEGTECTVDGVLMERFGSISGERRMSYLVLCALDNKSWAVTPQQLRLKRPPSADSFHWQRQELGDWDLMPWRPERVREGR